MNREKVLTFVKNNPNKFTYEQVGNHFEKGNGYALKNVVSGIIGRAGIRDLIVKERFRKPSKEKEFIMKKVEMAAYRNDRPRKELIPKAPNTSGILIIGDIHEPFTLKGYREFCIKTYKKYNCSHVIFIGDVIDNHFASYHEIDPDGHSGGLELDLAVSNIAKWVKAFPVADVIIGNHDRLIMRKAFSGGIPKRWIMDYKDVLGAPGWNFVEERLYNGIHFIHGEGSTARTRCRKDLISTVQGHRHPEAYTEYVVGETFKIFGMQVGCGVDRHSYAMAYAKAHPKPAIGVGVILDHGSLAFNVLMPL